MQSPLTEELAMNADRIDPVESPHAIDRKRPGAYELHLHARRQRAAAQGRMLAAFARAADREAAALLGLLADAARPRGAAFRPVRHMSENGQPRRRG
jgi:hypothetical protein